MKHGFLPAVLVAATMVGGAAVPLPAMAQDTVNILLAAPRSMTWYPFIVADVLGYFEEEGIEVNLLPSETNIPYVAFLQNGQADLATLDGPQTFQAAAAGLPFKIIYEVVQREQGGIVVSESSEIQGIPELAGKTIGLGTDRDTATVAMALNVHDMTLDQVNTVVVGEGIPVLSSAIESGTVDALAAGEFEWMPMEAGGVKLRRITPPEVTDVPGNNFAVSVATLEAKRPVFERFLRAWSKGVAATRANPEATVLILQRDVPQEWEDPDIGQRALDNLVYRTAITDQPGQIRKEVWDNMQQMMVDVGILEGIVDTSTFLDDSLIGPANDFDHDEVAAEIDAWLAANK